MNRRMLSAATVGVALAVAGCAAPVVGTPVPDPAPAPASGPGADPIAWMDRVCADVLSLTGPLTAAPDFGASADLAALRQTYLDYLGAAETGANQAGQSLQQVGASPVSGGDAALAKVRGDVGTLTQQLGGAKQAIETANPADLAAFPAAVGASQAALREVVVPDVLGAVAPIPRLARAAERAPACRQVGTLAGAAPR